MNPTTEDTHIVPLESETILSTTEYDLFGLLRNNREIYPGHVEILKKQFAISGNITQLSPVLMNEKMEIIDGQHRVVACQELGLPVYYIVRPGLRIEDAVAMNIFQKNWTVQDFAVSYANNGNDSYKRYLSLRDEFGFGHTITICYIANGDKSGIHAEFRAGELILDAEKMTIVRERLSKLYDTIGLVSQAKDKMFSIALLRATTIQGYNHERMLSKLRKYGDTMEKRYSTELDYLRELEKIYNWGFSENNHLRFF